MNPTTPLFGSRPAGVAPRLRDDLKLAASQEFEQILGRAGTPERARMEEAFRSTLNLAEGGQVDLDSLPEGARRRIVELQGAAEGFEALFVKRMLAQMRRSSFAEEGGPYGDLARDFMDQAIAQQAAESPRGFGIAQTVFRATVGRLLRESAGAQTPHPAPKNE